METGKRDRHLLNSVLSKWNPNVGGWSHRCKVKDETRDCIKLFHNSYQCLSGIQYNYQCLHTEKGLFRCLKRRQEPRNVEICELPGLNDRKNIYQLNLQSHITEGFVRKLHNMFWFSHWYCSFKKIIVLIAQFCFVQNCVWGRLVFLDSCSNFDILFPDLLRYTGYFEIGSSGLSPFTFTD